MPIGIGKEKIDKTELRLDRKSCKKFGPCGVGEKALYLGSRFIDSLYYVKLSSVKRAYKLIASYYSQPF